MKGRHHHTTCWPSSRAIGSAGQMMTEGARLTNGREELMDKATLPSPSQFSIPAHGSEALPRSSRGWQCGQVPSAPSCSLPSAAIALPRASPGALPARRNAQNGLCLSLFLQELKHRHDEAQEDRRPSKNGLGRTRAHRVLRIKGTEPRTP